MKARDFAPVEALHTEPGVPWVPLTGRREALSDALRGVEGGAYDDRAVGWFIAVLPDHLVVVLVSWLERVRAAERQRVLGGICAHMLAHRMYGAEAYVRAWADQDAEAGEPR